MYSRNARDIRDDLDDDMSEEEYEIYKYNIPPRYDGSRFRRRGRSQGTARTNGDSHADSGSRMGDSSRTYNGTRSDEGGRAQQDVYYADDRADPPFGDGGDGIMPEILSYGNGSLSAESSTYGEHGAEKDGMSDGRPRENGNADCTEQKKTVGEASERRPERSRGGILGGLKLGSEELLILALIFILSSEDSCGDDVILLLALLLLAG